MTNLHAIVGQNVRTARLAQELSQSQLASYAGISLRYLREIEHGRANALLPLIERLAEALNTTSSRLATPQKLTE